MENSTSKEKDVTLETTSGTEEKKNDNIFLNENAYMFRSAFRKLAKKYNKEFGREVKEEELIDLIRRDLTTKKQNSLLVKEYFKVKFFRELCLIALSALSITVAYDYFISSTGVTGLFPAGVGSIAKYLANITFANDQSKISSIFFVYQFSINIPLIIFGIFKLGYKFTVTTIVFMILQIAFDQLINIIPFINPNDFHFIIDAQFVKELDYSWNYAIWLFVLGIVGGALIGFSYACIYKVGGSSGGTDFITAYFSKRNNKPIGSLNRQVNLMVLCIVITCNTISLPITSINKDIVMREIANANWDSHLTSGKSFWEFFEGAMNVDYSSHDSSQKIDILNAWYNKYLSSHGTNSIDGHTYADLANSLPKKYTAIIKIEFIFGPSLFGSVISIVISGIVTNGLYPKYKLRTLMISTNRPKEVYNKIIERGFQNEIAAWETTNRSRGNYLHRTMFMLSMPVMQWRDIKKDIFIIDPYAKVTVVRTKSVEGLFKYEPVQNIEREELVDKVQSNTSELEKIRQIAIVKFKKQMELATIKRERIQKDYDAGGKRRKHAEVEIERYTKQRNELVTKFKKSIDELSSSSDTNEFVVVPNYSSMEELKSAKKNKKRELLVAKDEYSLAVSKEEKRILKEKVGKIKVEIDNLKKAIFSKNKGA